MVTATGACSVATVRQFLRRPERIQRARASDPGDRILHPQGDTPYDDPVPLVVKASTRDARSPDSENAYLPDPDDQSDWEIIDDAHAVGLKLLEDGPAGNHLQMESTIPVGRVPNDFTNIPEGCVVLPGIVCEPPNELTDDAGGGRPTTWRPMQ